MSHRICKTAKELSEAIKEETDVIEVEGDLSNKVVRIMPAYERESCWLWSGMT